MQIDWKQVETLSAPAGQYERIVPVTPNISANISWEANGSAAGYDMTYPDIIYSLGCTFIIPSMWDGASDLTMRCYWTPDPGQAIADGETVRFRFWYRSLEWPTEDTDEGSTVLVYETHTQSGAGNVNDTNVLDFTIDYNSGVQPVSAGDVFSFYYRRDNSPGTYSGHPVIIAASLIFTIDDWVKDVDD